MQTTAPAGHPESGARSATRSQPAQGLSRSAVVAYAAPVAPMSTLHAPALAILPALYANHTAVSLTTIGLILTITRLFDVVTDPLIGYFSDRSQSPWGRRKPMIVAGAALAAAGALFWLRPPPDAGATWFLLSSVAVYLGWTLVEVPHAAWLSEVAPRYDDRSRISAYRMAAYYLGYLGFVSAPLWPIFPTTEMTLQVTGAVAWILIAAIPLSVAWAVASVPRAVGEPARQSEAGLIEVGKALLNNGPFALLSASFVVSATASGMVAGLYFFFIDSYLGILDRIAHVGLIVAGLSVGVAFLWPMVLKRVEKHRGLAFCSAGTALTLVTMALIPPGPSAFPMLAAIFGLSAVLTSGSQVCLMAIMADVVDFDEYKTGQNKAANYYAFTTLYTKLGLAVGGGAAFIIVGLFGFDPTGENTTVAMAGFFLTFIGIPILLNLSAAALIWIFPIDRGRHRIIERALRRRRARTA
nr:MFS transporter [Marinicauda salina]